MLNNIGVPGLLLLTLITSTGFNPVPSLLFAAFMGRTTALGID